MNVEDRNEIFVEIKATKVDTKPKTLSIPLQLSGSVGILISFILLLS